MCRSWDQTGVPKHIERRWRQDLDVWRNVFKIVLVPSLSESNGLVSFPGTKSALVGVGGRGGPTKGTRSTFEAFEFCCLLFSMKLCIRSSSLEIGSPGKGVTMCNSCVYTLKGATMCNY